MSQKEHRKSRYPNFDAGSTNVLRSAFNLSGGMGLKYVGPEHVLMVVCTPKSEGREALERFGVDPDALVECILLATDKHAGPPVDPKDVVFWESTKRVMAAATSEALRTESPEVTIDHLLVAIVIDGSTTAAGILAQCGLTEEVLREKQQVLQDSSGTSA